MYAVEVRIICSKLHDVIVKWVSLEQNLSIIDWKYCIILERKIGEEKQTGSSLIVGYI